MKISDRVENDGSQKGRADIDTMRRESQVSKIPESFLPFPAESLFLMNPYPYASRGGHENLNQNTFFSCLRDIFLWSDLSASAARAPKFFWHIFLLNSFGFLPPFLIPYPYADFGGPGNLTECKVMAGNSLEIIYHKTNHHYYFFDYHRGRIAKLMRRPRR